MTPVARRMLRAFVREDLGQQGDITSRALLPRQQVIHAAITAQQRGVIAGTRYLAELFRMMDRRVRVRLRVRDGQQVRRGQRIADVAGPARAIMLSERTALNLLGHMSGVATVTRAFVDRVRGTRVKIYDTRKTRPGLRLFERQAVRMGGGHNHRATLSEGFLMKTNHLRALDGSRAQAMTTALRRAQPHTRHLPLVVEATNVTEVAVALMGRARCILLDNMSLRAMRQAVRLRNRLNRSVALEASGGISLRAARRVAATGVDRVSVGALTKNAPTIDYALRVTPAGGRRG